MKEYVRKKLDEAGIKYIPHKNGVHIKGVGNFYTATGKFSIDGVWYESDEHRTSRGIKKQIKKMISLMSQPSNAMYPPNPWSTGVAIPYVVEFHHEDGTVERIKS